MLASGSLLVAARAEDAPHLIRDLERGGIRVTAIGRLTDDPNEATLIVDGEHQPLPSFAVDELAPGES